MSEPLVRFGATPEAEARAVRGCAPGDKKNPFMTLQEKADAARRDRKGKLSSWLSGAGESGRDWHKTAHLMQQDLERIISAADVEGGGKDPAVYLAARWGHAEAVESLARLEEVQEDRVELQRSHPSMGCLARRRAILECME